MTKRGHPESAIQREIRRQLGMCGFDTVHVPNGSKLAGTDEQRAKQARNLKADGMVPGFPDLLVYASDGRIGHIEVKAPKGVMSDRQKAVKRWLEKIGHNYAICHSVGEAIDAVKAWGWLK